jgi:FkbM family methyltransferase|tara:strand:+ start:2678 stop:3781 length:1104 start_codon:yes stop_codon:yes gene_type:complete
MAILNQIYWLALMGPYIRKIVKNKISLMLGIVFGQNVNVKFNNGDTLQVKSSQYYHLLCVLGALTYSTSFSIDSKNMILIRNDLMNEFTVKFNPLSIEDGNLIELLYWGPKYGANFISNDEDIDDFRDKTFRIYSQDDKKIIENREGIKFFLRYIQTNNTITETFIRGLHHINSKIDFKDKIVIDAGAECGDTPLFFASKGARVYAFEPIKEHFEAMEKNFGLNKELSKLITPVNAAVGKDELLTFYRDNSADIGTSASFVYNKHGPNARKSEVQGMSLTSILKKYNIDEVDLLKMDCKGCEFFIPDDALKHIKRIKIEYVARGKYKVEDLLKQLKQSGFKCTMYRDSDSKNSSNIAGYLYGTRISE